jgi:catechol 2,3-dioxygenase-like lactoylglutathione lyase family enzyme
MTPDELPQPTAVRAVDVVVAAMPVLHVDDAERSVRFYCGRLGFRQDAWHQAGPDEPATVTVSRGGATVILTERGDVGREGQICLWTIELATLFLEWGGLEDVVLEHGPADMPWGYTEIAFRDPDGNRIRVAQPTGCRT